ncbi:putative aldehyde-dehydrogenase-like protein y4uC [Marinithermofilum abyssi]|uniref:3-sulfolactaldehyde dehydrogenase n=1 Tax=Marinithermofilum abyssi TaxID=1571185 RepID=A0A8J2VCR7_9BACL|nr:putative aldehyde-dehydrogenase-like protein y4uC [Marinithermofilum abyssi]
MKERREVEKKRFSLEPSVKRIYKIDVCDPQDGSLIARVPGMNGEEVDAAVERAQKGVQIARSLPSHRRMAILRKAADIVEERAESFAVTIAREGSKTIREARKEVFRCVETLRISAEEARRIRGETIPFDQAAGSEQRVGYYVRFPVGLIAAITPFNDPLNLVAHKVGPAIAAGNAIIVKPASVTPLSALKLAEVMREAGLPDLVLTVVTGHGREIGQRLVQHPAVRMVSFTGGWEAGEEIHRLMGLKKVSMELGSNSPAIVLSDADLDEAVECTVSGAFWAAGQNCLGVQRIFVEEKVFEKFAQMFVQRTLQYRVGDKCSEETDMGPLITEKEARRVERWVQEAVDAGARLLCGGRRNGAYYHPTVLTNVPAYCKVAREEVFGPVVSLFPVSGLEEAIQRANEVDYGLQAGIFTRDVHQAFEAVQRLEAGGVMVNDSSDYRVDAMPFGGIKGSGLGREGVPFAVQEMTETKVVCFRLG